MQLHPGFTFDDAAALAPYLAALGVSHLYCSPVLQAAPGSTHGYDVVDHGRLNEELGGAPGFERLTTALAQRGLSILLDIVPNHMALVGPENRWWWDVLEDGPSSRYARHFDIDWSSSSPADDPRVLVPVLDDHLGRVLEAGELGLERRGGSVVVTYRDLELPVSPRSMDQLLATAAARTGSSELTAIANDLGALPHASRTDPAAVDARHHGKVALCQRLALLCELEPAVAHAVDEELHAVSGDPDAIEALLARQCYRLARWRTADDEIAYRRFFSISSLAALRVEDREVFDESHRLIADLVARGSVTGMRVDHVDGLRDPSGYLRRLQELAPDTYLVVEKVLQPGEQLPASWPVAGTSGYDHLAAVNALFVDDRHEPAMTAGYAAFTGDEATFDEVAHEAKLHVMRHELAAETDRITELLRAACARRRRHRDHTRRELRHAVEEVAAALPVYRTYVTPGERPTAQDRAAVMAALAGARSRRPDLDDELLELIGRLLLLEEPDPDAEDLMARFQQLTPPVMAKGVEDTAFYRYHRLIALNEVGSDPGTFGWSVDAFHDHCAHLAERWPRAMGTLSTHDTKRSVDVRSRIALLSELPDAWAQTVKRWAVRNARHEGADLVDARTEALLYQTLVGAWPIETERLVAAIAKSTKEAKLRTSWTAPDPEYDGAVAAFTAAVVEDPAFVAELEGFLTEHRIVELGRITSLAKTTLLATSVGVPDVYQGTELWDLSLVDPDNRRPVDHEHRAALLRDLLDATPEVALGHLEDGGAKLWLLAQLLRHRRLDPEVYRTTAYRPLAVDGGKARHVVAFERGRVAVVVPRLLVGVRDEWGDTCVLLPAGNWVDVLTGDRHAGGSAPIRHVLARFPVSVLVPDDR